MNYPKRLIEVDLPIRRISTHARREKSIRHGHISTLHLWWARRPLAACRAVMCAALWPDPVDVTPKEVEVARLQDRNIVPNTCPPSFREVARKLLLEWTSLERQGLLSPESQSRFNAARRDPKRFNDNVELRGALLDFIADFANWDNSTIKEYLDTSRALTQAAHEALGGAPGTRPLVVDPFCGGGSIPLEALRVGADAFASDLNPIPVLLNKVVLEFVPTFGKRLVDEVRKWGDRIRREAEKELGEYYPKDPSGARPIAYLWARTVRCEGPECGAEVPLIRSLWIAKKDSQSLAFQLDPRPKLKRVDFRIIAKKRGGWVDLDDPKSKVVDPVLDGTVKRGSATCPCCHYTTPVARVREQLKPRGGGAKDGRLLCVVTTRSNEQGRFYRLPNKSDVAALTSARGALDTLQRCHQGNQSLVPDETLPLMSGVFNAPIYGHTTWGSLFTPRQALALTTIGRLTRKAAAEISRENDAGLARAVLTCLALIADRLADYSSNLCRWVASGEFVASTFGRQAIPMLWDFCEVFPLSESTGGYPGACEWVLAVLERETVAIQSAGHVENASATSHPLPTDAAQVIFTDPPYYNAVPYADLSDFFVVWLSRTLREAYPDLFKNTLSPKEKEICQMSGWDPARYPQKDARWFEEQMFKAMDEARRVLAPDGIGVIVFAHKSTSGWEAQLQAMIRAGWVVTGSWPIDTERGSRLRAMDSAALASSVHLICRPRENPDGSLRTGEIGDWRDVLAELPRRIHDWMPRLAAEGVVGADAIFACLGPALEIFSRHTRVEKASGDEVTLKEYLEQVWAAVAKEALTMIFAGADATGFEEDARLTAMWLWTLQTGESIAAQGQGSEDESADEDQEAGRKGGAGFVLEFDAARKIAQGLGAHLEELASIVEISGETAILRPVADRAPEILANARGESDARKKAKRSRKDQRELFPRGSNSEDGIDSTGSVESLGRTVLDRAHQSMLLFAAGRGEALRRMLVDEGVGKDERFWRLTQALTALYPAGTDERRWSEGVMSRKKALGF